VVTGLKKQILSWWELYNFMEMGRVRKADPDCNKLTRNLKSVFYNKNKEIFFLFLIR